MEPGKRAGYSSSSSLTSELFGSKDSTSSSAVYNSIFAPNSSKVSGRDSVYKKHDSTTHGGVRFESRWRLWDVMTRAKEDKNQKKSNEEASSLYEEQKIEPCHLSSSIYYGGQDIYINPRRDKQISENSTQKKDEEEDDTGSASRGNWWKGSDQGFSLPSGDTEDGLITPMYK